MSKQLEGKIALVTGAGKRIGRAIALRFAAEGAAVVVNYKSSRAEAEGVVREVESAGGRAAAMQADVTDRRAVEAILSATEIQFGGLDILVNNAGVFFHAPFDKLTDQQWDTIMAGNLKSQFICAQVAAPLLKRRGRGRIINLASLGGLLAWPGFTHYCVSKAGSIMLTRCLARALAPEILVNAIAPGTIQFPGEAPDEEYIRQVPLHATGKGDDIAGAALYLATAEFVTGQVLVVDGGRALV